MYANKDLQKKRQHEWYLRNKDALKEKRLEHSLLWRSTHLERAHETCNRWRYNLKILILTHYSPYGKPRCAHCGIDDLDVLTIDHINNDGYIHRKSIVGHGGSLYRWLKLNNFPDGYQVLCFNCNFKKRQEHIRELKRTK